MKTATSSQPKTRTKALPQDSAKAAGLHYTNDNTPGIERKRSGGGFRYVDAEGRAIRDPEILGRIKALVIPPAWRDVWICPKSVGHLQATGRDERGRKQYRYHPDWRAVREESKYQHILAFAKRLPAIRRRTEHDLGLKGLPKAKVLAAVVQLLEASLIRVGNDEYAKTNKSFGLTTMRDKHVGMEGKTLSFQFRGKSGVQHEISVNDARLSKIVKRCRDLPGQELFQYLDEEGNVRDIGSADVNEYIREISGRDFTAKDFRTWAGTVLASMALREFEAFDSQAQAKKNIVRAIESVSRRLGNTVAVCRKCYIHPGVMEAYLDGSMIETLRTRADEESRKSVGKLKPEEAAVLALLQNRLASEQTKRSSRPRSKTTT